MSRDYATRVDRRDGGVCVVALEGYIDAATAAQLDELFAQLIDEGYVRVVVDCSALEYVSSAGLGVFMAHVEEVRRRGGDIKFGGLNARIATIMEMLGFQHIFELCASADEACARFDSTQ